MSTTQLVSVNQTALLTTLMPSTPYTLAYALPLLLCSFCLTFAGAFLTLDRSRSFPPKYNSIPGDFFPAKRTRKLHWILEGGLGGLAAGYVFGVHLSTLLALMVPSLSASAPLSPKSFLAVWIMSAIATTFVSGRFKYVALMVSGLSGGATFSLALCVMLHPSLIFRVIFTAIIVPSLTILTLLPFPRIQHTSLRFALSSTGAFGIILGISLLAGIDSWADVWDRLWVTNGPAGQWGSSREKGLSAAYCFLLAGGMACDWILKSRFGENPDEKWDSYLANYSQNLPDRAGTYQPLSSIWTKAFGFGKHAPLPVPADVGVPVEEDFKPPVIGSPIKLQKRNSMSKSPIPGGFQPSPVYLKKGRSQRARERAGKRSRDPIKFGGDLSSSDSESESDAIKTPLGLGKERPWLEKRTSSSVGFAGTLRKIGEADEQIDVDKELSRVKAGLAEDDQLLDYSDIEDDVTTARDRNAPGWSPDFIRRNRAAGVSEATSQQTAVEHPSVFPAPVPFTPSLIKALDRIAVAQQTAFGGDFGQKPLRPGLPHSKSSEPGRMSGLPKPQSPPQVVQHKGADWDAFWKDVREKAGR